MQLFRQIDSWSAPSRTFQITLIGVIGEIGGEELFEHLKSRGSEPLRYCDEQRRCRLPLTSSFLPILVSGLVLFAPDSLSPCSRSRCLWYCPWRQKYMAFGI